MVLGEAIDHALQRDDSSGRKDPSLAHPAAQHLAHAPRAPDEFAGAAEQRTHRTGESFREAERNAVGVRRNILRGGFKRDGDIEDAGTIEMHRQSMRPRDLRDRRHVRNFHRRTATKIVRIFKRDQARLCEVGIATAFEIASCEELRPVRKI